MNDVEPRAHLCVCSVAKLGSINVPRPARETDAGTGTSSNAVIPHVLFLLQHKRSAAVSRSAACAVLYSSSGWSAASISCDMQQLRNGKKRGPPVDARALAHSLVECVHRCLSRQHQWLQSTSSFKSLSGPRALLAKLPAKHRVAHSICSAE